MGNGHVDLLGPLPMAIKKDRNSSIEIEPLSDLNLVCVYKSYQQLPLMRHPYRTYLSTRQLIFKYLSFQKSVESLPKWKSNKLNYLK